MENSTYSVRQAGPDDVAQVAPAFDAYRQFYGRESDLPAAERFLRDRLQASESTFLFAADDSTVLGFTQLYPTFTSVGMQRDLVLNDLYVSKHARRRGVATALLDAAVAYADKIGARGLGLETDFDNTEAQALYERYGFVNDTKHYYISADHRVTLPKRTPD